MLKGTALAAGLAGIVLATTGCGEDFRQYSSDNYRRATFSYSVPEFQGNKFWPCKIEIVHRKEREGINRHHLGILFIPCNENEIQGDTLFILSQITNENQWAYPNETPDGVSIHSENMYFGGAFCRSQVQYWVFAKFDPSHEIIMRMYDAHTETIKAKNQSEMDLEVLATYPEEKELDEDAEDDWDDAIDDNTINIVKEGETEKIEDIVKIRITVLRHLYSVTSGCYKWGGYLPPDKWGDAWTEALYFAEEGDLDYSVDLRSAGIWDLEEFNDPAIDIFGWLMRDVKKGDEEPYEDPEEEPDPSSNIASTEIDFENHDPFSGEELSWGEFISRVQAANKDLTFYYPSDSDGQNH